MRSRRCRRIPKKGVGFFEPDNAHLRQPTCGLTVEARPRTMLRPTTQACSEATTRPNTQYRPGTHATKLSTEYRPPSQRSTQSDEREVQVLALDFGVEPASLPMSHRSGSDASGACARAADQHIETIQHFPPPPHGLIEDDGKSSTTYASASVQDPGSLPPSRGMTPMTTSIMSPPPSRPHTGFVETSRPGTRGVDTSLAAPLESEEMQMMVIPDEEVSNVGSPRSVAGNLTDGGEEDDKIQGRASPGAGSEMLKEEGESEGVSRATTVRKKGEALEQKNEEGEGFVDKTQRSEEVSADNQVSVDTGETSPQEASEEGDAEDEGFVEKIQGSEEVSADNQVSADAGENSPQEPTKHEESLQPSPGSKRGVLSRRVSPSLLLCLVSCWFIHQLNRAIAPCATIILREYLLHTKYFILQVLHFSPLCRLGQPDKVWRKNWSRESHRKSCMFSRMQNSKKRWMK